MIMGMAIFLLLIPKCSIVIDNPAYTCMVPKSLHRDQVRLFLVQSLRLPSDRIRILHPPLIPETPSKWFKFSFGVILTFLQNRYAQNPTQKLVVLGVCAMDIKARNKAMTEILTRLVERSRGMIEVKVFGDKVILDEGEF